MSAAMQFALAMFVLLAPIVATTYAPPVGRMLARRRAVARLAPTIPQRSGYTDARALYMRGAFGVRASRYLSVLA